MGAGVQGPRGTSSCPKSALDCFSTGLMSAWWDGLPVDFLAPAASVGSQARLRCLLATGGWMERKATALESSAAVYVFGLVATLSPRWVTTWAFGQCKLRCTPQNSTSQTLTFESQLKQYRECCAKRKHQYLFFPKKKRQKNV